MEFTIYPVVIITAYKLTIIENLPVLTLSPPLAEKGCTLLQLSVIKYFFDYFAIFPGL